MKIVLLSLVLTLAGVPTSPAATITFQTGSSPVGVIKDAAGNPLTSSTAKVTIGFIEGWTGSAAQLTALRGGADGAAGATEAGSASTLAFLAANFRTIATVGSDADFGVNNPLNPFGIVDASNSVSGQIKDSTWLSGTANAYNSGGLIRGTKIFLLVHDGSVTGPDFLNLTGASFLGIFSASTWTLSTSGVVNAFSATMNAVDTSGEAFRGDAVSGSLTSSALFTVPEPSSICLLGALGFIALRRRR